MKNSILILFCLACGLSQAQLVGVETFDTLYFVENENIENFTTDHLGNVYFIKNEEVEKIAPYNIKNSINLSFSDPSLGEIKHIDVFNPMRIMLLYTPFNRIVFLDNKLNNLATSFNPENLDLYDVQLSSMSDQNRIWLYDQNLDQLVLWNPRIEGIEYSSQNITQIAGIENNPNYLVSDMNGVYINLPELGVLVFDVFGNYKKTIEVKGLNNFQIKDQRLYYYQKGELFMVGLKNPLIRKVKLPALGAKKLRVENQLLYLLTNQGLLIVKNPFL